MRKKEVFLATLIAAMVFAGATFAGVTAMAPELPSDDISEVRVVGAPSNRAMLVGPQADAVTTAEPLWRWPAESGSFDATFWQSAPIITDGQAYYRDVVVGSHIVVYTTTGLTEGESWGATFISPSGVRTGPTTVYMRAGCFVGPGWRDCYWDLWGLWAYDLAFYVPVQCKEPGLWLVEQTHNGAVFSVQTFVLLPQIEEARVEHLNQHDPAWGDNAYDSICYNTVTAPKQSPSVHCPAEPLPQDMARCTVSKKGCTITAATILLKYHRITRDPSGNDLTPGALNTWLTNNAGYNRSGNLKWDSLPLFASACGGVLKAAHVQAPLSMQICSTGPQFIKIPSGRGWHWLLAYGEDDSRTGYLVRDPNSDRLAFSMGPPNRGSAPPFYGRTNQLSDAYNGLHFDFYCPVELVLTDPLGRKTGFDPATGTRYDENPDAGYDNEDLLSDPDEAPDPDSPKTIEVWGATDGDYTLAVIGIGTGTYDADIYARYNYSGYAKANVATLGNIGISANVMHTYAIHYENKAGSPARLSGGFDGGGQRPKDVNKFLSYANPSESQTKLPPGTTSFPLMIFYADTVLSDTFQATLNGVSISSQFHPVPGGRETVNLAITPGRNVLALSIDGNLSSRVATDTDRLVLNVQ